VIESLTGSTDAGTYLVNMSECFAVKGQGTYRYMGEWEMIDQIIVSKNVLTSLIGLHTDSTRIRIFKPDFLLHKDPKYPGFSPYSTYRGYKYQGGFSDHLPVYIDLSFR
jgi:hypothetical protein